jgi:hypothetical protein
MHSKGMVCRSSLRISTTWLEVVVVAVVEVLVLVLAVELFPPDDTVGDDTDDDEKGLSTVARVVIA